MIKSSKISIKFSNTNKKALISDFISEYKQITQQLVDILWNKKDNTIPTLLPKEITSKINSWLSKRIIQCSAKQASGIVRGTLQKQKRRLNKIQQLNQEGKFRHARNLQLVYDKNISPELDSRFIKIDLENKTSFDGWITISQLGNKTKIKIPFKRTKHFNKLIGTGRLKSGIRLRKINYISARIGQLGFDHS